MSPTLDVVRGGRDRKAEAQERRLLYKSKRMNILSIRFSDEEMEMLNAARTDFMPSVSDVIRARVFGLLPPVSRRSPRPPR